MYDSDSQILGLGLCLQLVKDSV